MVVSVTADICKRHETQVHRHSSPGGNTPQVTNYTATCLLSRKLSKLDKLDMQDTFGEAGTSS